MSNISYVYGTESDKYNAYTIYRDGRRLEPEPLAEYIEKLEAEVEELKPYKYGYSTRKKPKPHEWVIVDYKEHLYFGYYDDDKRWATQYRDNIREGVRRWYPVPELSEDFDNDPA